MTPHDRIPEPMFRAAVNQACTCGGRGPDDDPCPACVVWHLVCAAMAEAKVEASCLPWSHEAEVAR